MGMMLGKIRVKTPKYELIKACKDYTIHKYGAAVAAHITYNPSEFKGDKDGRFAVLAKYIGVFRKPQNARPEKIAMTAPVISKTAADREQIAMLLLLSRKRVEGWLRWSFFCRLSTGRRRRLRNRWMRGL
ncbi:hypothetical protein LINGRAPRIM_LOCUS399 [Linum grandiflorum]